MKHLAIKTIIALFVIVFTQNNVYSQVQFTEAELLVLAKNNTERLYLKDLTELQQSEIDSLYIKVNYLQSKFELCESNEEVLNSIISKLEEVDQKRKEQIAILSEENEKQKHQITKKERKLNRWRIATPIVTIGAFIVGLFVK